MNRMLGIRMLPALAGLLSLAAVTPSRDARAAGKAEQWRVPIVMERSTVRGKVVILESRAEERKTLADLPVELWTSKQGARGQRVPASQLHATRTDADGFFSLPVVDVGQYVLIVGKLQLQLTVIPEADVREGQEQEPKVLLILLPKEVI